MSPGERGASSSSCTSVNTVCSDGERPASLSLSSSASSASLQDASSSSSSSSLPYGAVPAYDVATAAAAAAASSCAADGNRSDISLDLTPLAAAKGGRPADPAPRQLSRLERVVMEIVETERAYVRDLKSIVEVRRASRHQPDWRKLEMKTLAKIGFNRHANTQLSTQAYFLRPVAPHGQK